MSPVAMAPVNPRSPDATAGQEVGYLSPGYDCLWWTCPRAAGPRAGAGGGDPHPPTPVQGGLATGQRGTHDGTGRPAGAQPKWSGKEAAAYYWDTVRDPIWAGGSEADWAVAALAGQALLSAAGSFRAAAEALKQHREDHGLDHGGGAR